MKRIGWLVSGGAGGLGLLVAAFALGRAQAEGVPTQALFYSGVLDDNGMPVSGPRQLAVALWPTDAPSGEPLCETMPVETMVTNGHFRIPLGDCESRFRDRPDIFLQPIVGSDRLPPRKAGAVPYALEAARASQAGGALKAQLTALETRVPAARTAFHAFKDDNQMISPGAWAPIAFRQEQFDHTNEFDEKGGFRFTVRENGMYHITCSVMYRDTVGPGAGGTAVYVVAVVSNEMEPDKSQIVSNSINGGSDQTTVVASRVAPLSAGDVISCMAYQSSPGSKTIYAQPEAWSRSPRNFFNVVRVF